MSTSPEQLTLGRAFGGQSTPRSAPAAAWEHLALVASVLHRELERREAACRHQIGGFPVIEEVRAALDSVAALRGTLQS